MTPPVILPYRSFGSKKRVTFKGHVLDDRLLYESQKGDKRRKNFKAMLSRFWSSVIPDIRVEVTFQGKKNIFITNETGLFEGEMFFDKALPSGWHQACFKVLDKIVDAQEEMSAFADIYIQGDNSQFGVISDVDDTILISHSTQILRKLRLIFTKNAHTRLPFPGVAEFYQALQAGTGNNTYNPIYYVSSSEWNLYDFLEDFCDYKQIPKGVFFLQDLKTSFFQFLKRDHQHLHKYEKIKTILQSFPKMNFILIGDNGQKDPVLYTRLFNEFPGRILAIYIREVKTNKKVKELNQPENGNPTVNIVYVEDTAAAAIHALKHGFISEDALFKINQSIEIN